MLTFAVVLVDLLLEARRCVVEAGTETECHE